MPARTERIRAASSREDSRCPTHAPITKQQPTIESTTSTDGICSSVEKSDMITSGSPTSQAGTNDRTPRYRRPMLFGQERLNRRHRPAGPLVQAGELGNRERARTAPTFQRAAGDLEDRADVFREVFSRRRGQPRTRRSSTISRDVALPAQPRHQVPESVILVVGVGTTGAITGRTARRASPPLATDGRLDALLRPNLKRIGSLEGASMHPVPTRGRTGHKLAARQWPATETGFDSGQGVVYSGGTDTVCRPRLLLSRTSIFADSKVNRPYIIRTALFCWGKRRTRLRTGVHLTPPSEFRRSPQRGRW